MVLEVEARTNLAALHYQNLAKVRRTKEALDRDPTNPLLQVRVRVTAVCACDCGVCVFQWYVSCVCVAVVCVWSMG